MYYLLKDVMCLLNVDGTQAIKQVPDDYVSFIKEYYPAIDSSKIVECVLIDTIKGGKYYVAKGSDTVLWIHKHHIEKVFTNYDNLVEYFKDNNLIKGQKCKQITIE